MFFKNCSPIILKKREILKLLLSDSYVKEKNLYFSITKPFDKFFFPKGCNAWCGLLSIPTNIKTAFSGANSFL